MEDTDKEQPQVAKLSDQMRQERLESQKRDILIRKARASLDNDLEGSLLHPKKDTVTVENEKQLRAMISILQDLKKKGRLGQYGKTLLDISLPNALSATTHMINDKLHKEETEEYNRQIKAQRQMLSYRETGKSSIPDITSKSSVPRPTPTADEINSYRQFTHLVVTPLSSEPKISTLETNKKIIKKLSQAKNNRWVLTPDEKVVKNPNPIPKPIKQPSKDPNQVRGQLRKNDMLSAQLKKGIFPKVPNQKKEKGEEKRGMIR